MERVNSIAIEHPVISTDIGLKQPMLWVVCLCLVDIIVPNFPFFLRHCGTMVGNNEWACTTKIRASVAGLKTKRVMHETKNAQILCCHVYAALRSSTVFADSPAMNFSFFFFSSNTRRS